MAHPPKRLRKLVCRGLIYVWCLTIVAVAFINLRLYSPTPLAKNKNEAPPTLLAQLAANRAALDAGSPSQMQALFPEGYYFSYLFHGLTWVELAMRDHSFSEPAIQEAIWCLDRLDSPPGRAPFPPNLPPDHGMFYSAWKCSLRAGLVCVQQGEDPVQLASLRQECDAIARAIQRSETPFLASYEGAAWPCDTVPAIHALSAYDQITREDRYGDAIAAWLEESLERLDPETGLLPHTAQLPDGRNVGVARATSHAVMLRLLPDIDAAFARRQYERFRQRFLTTFCGAPCLLEYPSGVSGEGDVDSGPLILGRSLSATVMMMGVAQIYGDHTLADAIAQSGETVGMPWTSQGSKQYVGGFLPIGDIIVAYAHVARPWFAGREHQPESEYRVASHWRWQVHAVSLVVLLPAAVFAWRKWR